MNRSLALPFRLLGSERGLIAGFAAASLGRPALTAASILLIREFLGGVLGQREGLAGWAARTYGSGTALWGVVALLMLAHLGATALTYSSQISQQKIVKVIELGTMERLIRQLLGLSIGFFDRRTQGDLIQTVRQDVSHLRSVVVAAASLLVETLQAAGLVIAAVTLSRSLALWAFLLMPLAALPLYVIARRTLAHSFGEHRSGVALLDVLLQLLRGIRIIKIYQGEEAQAERTIERARQYFDQRIAMERARARARVVIESLAGLSLMTVIIVGGFQVLAGTLGWPALLAFLMATRAAQSPLSNVHASYLEIQRHRASLEHIDALLREPSEIRDRPDARPLTTAPSTIALEGVTFAIGGTPLLQDVSFQVRSGETLGVAGHSGAGKTTLLSLMARFYDPTCGAVLFDGNDVRGLRLRDVQRHLAIVTQEPFLFAASVRDNIRCGRPAASDAEVEAAARAAGIHGDIMGMPEGYQTLLGLGGRQLSRGEAQRINIARAILKGAPILLLDEATSSLDPWAEARVQEALERLASGRLTIWVAHRLSTLRKASRILVLEAGRVVGLGTHAHLLEQCPTYRRLWAAQAGPAPDAGFSPDAEQRSSETAVSRR